MSRFDEKLSDDAVLLNDYLNQYVKCINKKRNLERRRNDILREFNSPLGAVVNDGMPRGNSTGVGCAALSFRLDEIETRIREQLDGSLKALADIMDVIEFLPENAMERAVAEHKYIDGYGWDQICRAEHISKTPVLRYWRKGLYMLLGFPKVRQILREYEKANYG